MEMMGKKRLFVLLTYGVEYAVREVIFRAFLSFKFSVVSPDKNYLFCVFIHFILFFDIGLCCDSHVCIFLDFLCA